MTFTPVTGGLALLRCGGRGECQRSALGSYPWVYKQSNNPLEYSATHRLSRDSRCVFDEPDRCCSLGFSCYLPGSSGDSHIYTQTHSSRRLCLTHQIYEVCTSTHTNAAVFQLVCGRGCVYQLEECTVFGNVKSSPQWSGAVQTRSVLLDGPEIPLCTPRSEEFKGFNVLSYCRGSDTTMSNTTTCVES